MLQRVPVQAVGDLRRKIAFKERRGCVRAREGLLEELVVGVLDRSIAHGLEMFIYHPPRGVTQKGTQKKRDTTACLAMPRLKDRLEENVFDGAGIESCVCPEFQLLQRGTINGGKDGIRYLAKAALENAA
jgi:hypothetical protein